jgi:hypothetical protein
MSNLLTSYLYLTAYIGGLLTALLMFFLVLK